MDETESVFRLSVSSGRTNDADIERAVEVIGRDRLYQGYPIDIKD